MVQITYAGEVFAVNVNWNADNREWNVNANRLDDNRWNAGNRAFSATSVFLPLFYEAEVFD